MLEPKLLTRTEFREKVFERDNHRCIICGQSGKVDAHHIMERRLFPDGGYYLDNGATLCDPDCHLAAEQTVLTTEEIREKAGINSVILPPHLYHDERYDKWGNPYLPNGIQRMRGELFHDASVQKVLSWCLGEFTKYVKYPRTHHFPWSPGISKDDRINEQMYFDNEVIITEKRDGENTTMYNDYIHTRSVDYAPHPSRDYVKSIWASVCYNIPEGWRICGENLFAQHSIPYNDLRGYFEIFSVWNEFNECLSWEETVEWSELLGLPRVPVLYQGEYDGAKVKRLAEIVVENGGEGIVCRSAGSFHYSQFPIRVAKYVRKGHVQTHGHWMRMRLTPNQLAK
jgi:hypothetical protein